MTYEIVGLTQDQARQLADVLCGTAVWANGHAWISEACVVRPQGCQCPHCRDKGINSEFHNIDDVVDIRRLKQELSLAEEGLANYAQKNQQLRAALDAQMCCKQDRVCEQLRKILNRAVDTMAALHRAIEPMEDDPELAGRVPPAAMRTFVDDLAEIDRERFDLHPRAD